MNDDGMTLIAAAERVGASFRAKQKANDASRPCCFTWDGVVVVLSSGKSAWRKHSFAKCALHNHIEQVLGWPLRKQKVHQVMDALFASGRLKILDIE